MRENIKEVFNNIMKKLYPEDMTCLFCGNELKYENVFVCEKCQPDLEKIEKPCLKCGSPCHSLAEYCINCQNNKRNFEFARAPFVYSGKIARAIQSFKYNGKKYLAYPLAKFLEKEVEKLKEKDISIDAITYVPLFKSRQKKRGYNQAELLAEELSKTTNIVLIKNNLIRIRDTETQTHLTHKERQKNLDKAFKIKDATQFKNKDILLIDDVLTTGATADCCAKELKKAKAKNVYILTIAIPDAEKSVKKNSQKL